MNKLHARILDELNSASKKDVGRFNIQGYIGTSHKYTGISNKTQSDIAKKLYKENPEITFNEFIDLLNSLNNGKSFSEKTIGPMLLSYYKNFQNQITPDHLDSWLENLEGWAEIDTLCQSTFKAETLLAKWNIWDKALDAFSKDKNINKRRASMVLLCKSVRESNDPRLKIRSFKNVEQLKKEKEILITKAVSWILRSMIKNFKNDVQTYLEKNMDSLPKIAIRETRRKLLTGKK
jgi:3-methyladenine DNA glycosylase AlkD